MTNESLLSELITEAVPIVNPAGFVPLGSSEGLRTEQIPGIPQTLDELTTQVSRTFDLTFTAAASLNIPVIGSVSGGVNRRVIVLERTAYKEITFEEIKYQFGYAIRLALTVSKITADAKLSLPFMAASAEVGQVEAKWVLQVIGLSGPKIDGAVLPPKELNVETFVLANQSLDSLIKAVRDATTVFKAEVVALVKPADMVERELLQAIGTTYALGRLERARKRGDAIKDVGVIKDQVRDAILDTYKDFAGITSDAEVPSPEVRSRALAMLGPIKAEPR